MNAVAAFPAAREQSRARYPDRTGFVVRDGIRTFYEVYGSGDPPILFVPTWSIVHSRIWKGQIPWFARRHKVVTFDAIGNGRSDRPTDPAAYAERRLGEDIGLVLDAAKADRAVLVTLSLGAPRSLAFADEHPDRVAGMVCIGPAIPLGSGPENRGTIEFEEHQDSDEGWAKYNADYWRRDYEGFLEFFFGQCFNERHSTKQIEDTVGWGLDSDAETLIATERAPGLSREETLDICARLQCPVLIIQGTEDAITGPSRGVEFAKAVPGARLVLAEGGGHVQNGRDPIWTNLVIRDFVAGIKDTA